MEKISYQFNCRIFIGCISVLLFLILTGSFGYTAPALTSKDLDKAANAKIQKAYGKLPLYFIRNDGQVDRKVKYYEKGSGHATFFTKEGVYLALGRRLEVEGRTKVRKESTPKSFTTGQAEHRIQSPHYPQQTPKCRNQSWNPKAQPVIASDQRERGNLKSEITRNSKPATRNSELIKLTLLDANKDPEIVAEGQQAGKVNYFIGNDPEKWRTDIPTYRVVVYKEVYPGIDMKFYGSNSQLEYDIIISPGADPSTVKLSCEGIESMRVTEEGDLEIGLREGKIFQKKPYIYQVIDGIKVEIKGKFVIRDRESSLVEDSKNTDTDNGYGQRSYGFELASYNKAHPIIIDPVLVYSTYLGGSDSDYGLGIAVDNSGNVYLTGDTSSINFPTQSPLQPNNAGANDAFVTKINPAGDALVYSTYLGGSSDDAGNGIAVDSSENVYLTGLTYSFDFPIQNPLQLNNAGNYDVFITKINPAGDALVSSTYFGGSDNDVGRSIAVDSSGNAYLTGYTQSTDFPTQNPIQPNYGGGNYDVFITKINSLGDALVYSTYLGGSDWDISYGITVDDTGNAYLTGYTRSSNFPTQSPLQPNNAGANDAFVTKINPAGDALVYSTYLGGNTDDGGYGIAVDSSENAYLTGYTSSIDFPTQNPIQPNNAGANDAFVTKINPAGDALVYSTYLGGTYNAYGWSIAVDSSENAYLTGYTNSIDFPTQNSIQPNNAGDNDVFITKINPTGDTLVYSTYIGGSNHDRGWSIAVDSSGNAYLTGDTTSSDFPTQNPLQPNHGGGYDAFLTKIGVDGPIPDIKSNNSDGPIDIISGDLLTVTIELNSGDYAGQNADWYVYAATPFGPYYYDSSNWVPGSGITYSGPLSDLTTYEVLNSADLSITLPAGPYTFCFDIDIGQIYSDCVAVNINPPPLTIAITSPADGTVFNRSPITVSGNVTNNADVTVNGIQASVVSGTFTASIPLSEGQNTITAAATDQYSQTAFDSITVTLITKGSITGTVTDALTTLPLPYAMVTVTDFLNIPQAVFTDTNGTYTINDIASGDFSGSITKDGYTAYNFSDTMTPGQTITIDTALSLGPPTISNITATLITSDAAIITWTTDHYTDSLIEYGETISYGTSKYDPAMTTYHSFTLTNLTLATTYHYRVTSTNSYGRSSTSADNTFTTLSAASPITLDITYPSDNSTINRPDTGVIGTVTNTTGNETGVTVNGIVAVVNGNQFFVNSLPLQEGQNTITAIATDTEANKTIAAITVNAAATPHITLRANIESGISPLTTYFSVETAIPNAVTTYEMDFEGDGTIDYTGATFQDISFTYTAEGVYYPTVIVTDTEAITYSSTMGIVVLNLVELDTLLKAKWDGMKTALANQDIEGSLDYFVEESQEMYRYNFELMQSILPTIVQDMSNIAIERVENSIAEYEMLAAQDEIEYSFYIEFTKDFNGIWKIRFF